MATRYLGRLTTSRD